MMRFVTGLCWSLAPLSFALMAAPALAGDLTVSGTLYNYATVDSSGAATSSHEGEIVLEGTTGDWQLGATLWAGVTTDWQAGELTVETPTLELYAQSEASGRLAVFDTYDAFYDKCVTPTEGTTNFTTEALMSFGTCAGYNGVQAITFTTPEFGDGFALAFSAMADIKGIVESGEVDSSLSSALTFDRQVGELQYSASLAVDMATGVKDGLPSGQELPITVQAGGTVRWDDWSFGTAAQYEFASIDGGDSWGLGTGISRAVTEQLTLGAELAVDRYQDSGTSMDEVSLGATAEYAIISDTLTIDGSLNVLRRTGGGTDETVTQIGTGLIFSF